MTTEAYHGEVDGWHSFIDDHIAGVGAAPTGRVFGDPGVGNMYLGTSTIVAGREAALGHAMGAQRTYFTGSNWNALVSQCATDIAAGRVPCVSMKLSVTWAQFAAGAQDAAFASCLANLDAIGGGPIILTLHHEPNGDGQPSADYLAMYRHAMTLKAAYPQILLTPILAGGYWAFTHGLVFGDWMQPDSCDVFGVDSYNPFSVPSGKPWYTVDQAFKLQGAACLALDDTKPWGVFEYGCRTDPSHVGKAGTWFNDAYNYARVSGCMIMTYFDSALNVPASLGGPTPWSLNYTGDGTDGTERMNAFGSELLAATTKFIPHGGIPA